eukprot:gene14299-21929_t
MTTIRLEDLGEPIQKLLRAKGGHTEDDLWLMEYVHVTDMARIFTELSKNRPPEDVWTELKAELQGRRDQQALSESTKRLKREQRRKEAEAEKAVLLREEEAEQTSELSREPTHGEEEEDEAEKERLRVQRKADRRRKRREREEELRLQQQLLEQEEAEDAANLAEAKEKKKTLKDQWKRHVEEHPLAFSSPAEETLIEQEPMHHSPARRNVQDVDELVHREWKPECRHCGTTYLVPPAEWTCTRCPDKPQKVWQPDDHAKSKECCVCPAKLFFMNRHHCRKYVVSRFPAKIEAPGDFPMQKSLPRLGRLCTDIQ